MTYDTEDVVMGCGGVVIGLLLVGLIGYIVTSLFDDTILARRAFDATVACETRRMLPHRKFLSATVVCVPALTRQDTTTVHVQ